jgi:hypothetical protein
MATQSNPAPNPAPEPQDAGHVPITEEFDSPKHTLPDKGPIIIALVLVAIVVAAVVWFFRATPVASGTIDEAFAIDVPGQGTVLATVQLTLKNITEKPLVLRNINISIQTDKGEFSDDFSSIANFQRYFQAFPELQQHSIEGLPRELKIPPGSQVSGSVIVSFPISKQEFDARRGLSASVSFHGQPLVVLKR